MCGVILFPNFDRHGGMEKKLYEVRSLFMDVLNLTLDESYFQISSFNTPADSISAKLLISLKNIVIPLFPL